MEKHTGPAASEDRPAFAKSRPARRKKVEVEAAPVVDERPKRVRRTKAQIEADQAALLSRAQKNALGDRVKIILEENPNIGPTGLPLGHNGDQIYVVPGEVVNLPRKFLEILDNAVEGVPQKNPDTDQVTIYRERRKYPYRLVG